MSVIYLFAFASLFVQIPGLYGENGILPAKFVLQNEAESLLDLVTVQPTLLRLLPKVGLDLDTGMDFLCIGGALLAFVAMVSRDQRNCVVFAVLWMFYLSLFQVGQTFLWFQWDILLLEAGFLTILIAPLNFFGYLDVVWQLPHDSVTFWLVRWLLFRRTFASGVSKLASEGSSWWALTEISHHYETQHLPTPLAWYFHQLPDWFHRVSTVAVITIQIPISLLFFSPYKNQRRFAFYCQCLLSTVMMLSGNYGFYTLLTLTLSLSLVDDSWLQSWTGNRFTDLKELQRKEGNWQPMKWIFCGVTYGALILGMKRLFALELTLMPLQITSNTAFTAEDLDCYLRWLTPISILIATSSLLHQVYLSTKKCLANLKNKSKWAQNSVNLLGCFFFGLLTLAVFSISLVPHSKMSKDTEQRMPDQLKDWHKAASQNYQLASPYMFYTRPDDTEEDGRVEVVIEGSHLYNDDWKEYDFRFKPGNVTSNLAIVSPHQPRLDWQMWFVARGDYENNHWLLNLVYRLLTNQKEVLELMGDNPFSDEPPKYIRCTLYKYHFASNDKSDDKYSPTNWWVREPLGEYLPILSLDEPSLMDYIEETGLQTDTQTKKPTVSNLLRGSVENIRSLFGQGNGSVVCLVLVIAGFLLTLLDPSINLLGAAAGVEPMANGGSSYSHYRAENDVK